ncbi:hypothetical protein [Streptomyces bottropensis]|uniref:hypothetical protein n=1 Tax=Streptomyces bottropensis TaxID=42235 RepID=UPI0036913511
MTTAADQPQRIRLDDLTSDQYDELCDDLDEYERVQGDMNERAIDLTRRAETAEKELRESQWRHQDAERRVRCQRERAETAEAGQLLLARTIAATSKQTVEQVLADVRAALAPAQEPTP